MNARMTITTITMIALGQFAPVSGWAQSPTEPPPIEPPPTPGTIATVEAPVEAPAPPPGELKQEIESAAPSPDPAPAAEAVPSERATLRSSGTPTLATSAAPRRSRRPGVAVLVGGGFENFGHGDVRARLGGGGSWSARFVGGTRQYFGLEAAYVGAAHEVLGVASSSALVSNGLEGALRLNLPIVSGRALVEPFGFVGLGWQHYALMNADAETSELASADDVMTLPYGGGLDLAYGRLMVDARFTYRQTYRNDLLRAEGERLDTWGVGGNVGVEF
jgi:hypothetical protein